MTCEDVGSAEVVEQYVLGRLSEESRDAFEQHYFECARCFGLVKTYQELQAELARTRDAIVAEPHRHWVWQWGWLPAAAVVVIAASVVVWQRPTPAVVEPRSEQPGPSSPSDRSAVPGAVARPQPSSATPSLDELARVEPPRYVQGRLRGAPDPASAKFEEAMDRYQRRDYAGAVANLREASMLDPDAPHIAFFLGASHLLSGHTNEAVDGLRKAVALGDSDYLEDAHFYLAKAYVKLDRIDEAIAELEQTTRLRGERQAEARLLLNHVQEFKNALP